MLRSFRARLSLASLLIFCACSTLDGQDDASLNNDPDILALLKSTMAKNDQLPGVIAAIKRKGQPIRIAANGIRKSGESEAITAKARMHLGSCTKALTATMIARLVEQGKLSWETTIAEGLPRLAKKIHQDFHAVTLLQLLQHRGSIPRDAKDWWMDSDIPMRKRRENIAAANLADPPKVAPGTKYDYSNLSYMIAGMFAEKALSKSWEEIIKQELFEPLGLESAGFGPPGEKGKLTEPWGHRVQGEKLVPIQHDNAPALGPAGTVHMTIDDWATFSMVHIDGKHEDKPFISPESLAILQTKGPKQVYACGWMVFHRPWGKGTVLTHSGTNTMWFCTVWVAPQTKTAYFVATNAFAEKTAQQVDALIYQVILIDRK